jgi:uncharacterized protein (DUF302 family)
MATPSGGVGSFSSRPARSNRRKLPASIRFATCGSAAEQGLQWERECDMTQTTQASVTSQTIVVEHIRISSGRSFAEVRRKLEGTVPKLDTGIAEALRSGDQKRAKDYEENGPKLSIFGERDHGALLQIAGSRRNAVQYEIGNPLTASKMTRHQLPAALYAPLRMVLFEDEQGKGIFEYDKPSSFFGQYGDERVTEVGRYLDVTLEAVLRNAAE